EFGKQFRLAEVHELAHIGDISAVGEFVERASPLAEQLRLAAAGGEALLMWHHASEALALAQKWSRRGGGGAAKPRDQLADQLRLYNLDHQLDSVRAIATRLAAADTGENKLWDLGVLGATAAQLNDERGAT